MTHPNEMLTHKDSHRIQNSFMDGNIWRGIVAALVVMISGIGTTVITTEHVTTIQQTKIEYMEKDIKELDFRFDEISENLNLIKRALNEIRVSTMNTHNARRIASIIAIITNIDRDDPTLWTTDGYPRVSIIEDILRKNNRLDWQITAGERDLACVMSSVCGKR